MTTMVENVQTMAALRRLRDAGYEPGMIVDVGASDGSWSRDVRAIWTDCPLWLFEPRAECEPRLQAFCAHAQPAHYRRALLSSEERLVAFYHDGLVSSVYGDISGAPWGVPEIIRSLRLDDLLAEWPIPHTLLKLDVQGHELEVLRGARELLRHAEVIVCEVSFFEHQQGIPRVKETIFYLGNRGFDLYDVGDFYDRQIDGRRGQADFIFIHETSLLVAEKRWTASGHP